VLFVEEVEVDVSEVDYEEVDNIFAVFFELFEYLFFFLLIDACLLVLAELKLSVKIRWKFLYFLDFCAHAYLHYYEFVFGYGEGLRVGVEVFEGEGEFCELDGFVFGVVEVVDALFEFG
jgi:hypothetical protein